MLVGDPVENQILATAVFLAWSPVVVVLFKLLGRRTGTLAAVVGGYLFLPRTWIRPPGLLHFLYFEKQAAIGLAIALAMLVWDWRLLLRFRPKAWDIPVLTFTGWAAVVVFAGQFVDWDVADLILQRRLWWIFPYLAGRLYFTDTEGAGAISLSIVVATLLLVPLVALEAMVGPAASPMALIYGTPSGMVTRLGGWRPEVFFDHGIELSCWMALAAVTALWLWLGGAWKPQRGPACWPTFVLVPATLITRGVYGYVDLAAGAAATLVTLAFRTRAAIVVLALSAPLYIGLRVSGGWDGQNIVKSLQSTGRELTVAARLVSEDRMIAQVLNHNPAFGFGRPLGFAWRAEGPVDCQGADGAWLIYLWTTGLVGLSLYHVAQYLIPAGLALSRPRGRPDRARIGAPEWGLALFVILAMIDGLHNMPSFAPLPLIVGALVGQAVNPRAGSYSGPRGKGRATSEGRGPGQQAHSSAVPEGWDATVRRGGFVLAPAAVATGLACLLYVFGHGPVEGFEGVKLVGGLGAALLFSAAGAAGSWASRRASPTRLVVYAVLFAALGASFNLALHPSTRPGNSADILQGMALCGLVVALWRRAFGNAAWADAILATAPLVVHLVVRPYLRDFPGSQYLFAGQGPTSADSLFPVFPWLTFAALGGRALRDSAAIDLASGVLLGLGAAAVVTFGPTGSGPVFEKFPMNLPYALLGGALVGLAFALGRFSGFKGPPAQGLRWLGRQGLVFFYAHFGVAKAVEAAHVHEPRAVWLLLAVGSLAATWLISAAASPFARWFRNPAPWLVLFGSIALAWKAPGLPPMQVTALSGLAGLVFAAYYRELAALVAGASSPASVTSPRRPDIPEVVAAGPWHALVRAVLLVVALAAPEILAAVLGTTRAAPEVDPTDRPGETVPSPTPPGVVNP